MFLMIILYLVLAAILAVLLLFTIQFKYWAKRGVLHLKPTFPFGRFGGKGKPYQMNELFIEDYQEFKGKTPFVGIFFFFRPGALIIDLELVHQVLIKDFNKFHDRGAYYNERDDPLSAHLITLHGDKWRTLRSKMTPFFTSAKIKFMFSTLIEVVDNFDNTLSEMIATQMDLEVRELVARFTTDVIARCAFGVDCNSLKYGDTEFRRMGRLAFGKPRHSSWMLALLCEVPNLARNLHIKITRDDVNEFFLRVVRETVLFRERNNIRRNDFMDLLIQLNNRGTDGGSKSLPENSKFTLEEIAAQALLFFLAGFETSSANMAFTLYELASNPHIQQRARSEINDVLNKHEGQLTYEAMKEMKYMDWVLHESLRKYPPVIALPRISDGNYKVPNTEYIIEKGLRVIIPVYAIHHDPDIYPNPNMFEPERFSPEEVKKRHPMSFLPFGDGPRNCIGARFGKMQSKAGLIMLLRNYRFSVCSETPETLQFTNALPILTPKGGLWLNVEKV